MYTLITGGSGFIGQNYILHLQKIKKLKNVINIDCLNYAGKFQLMTPCQYRSCIYVVKYICLRHLCQALWQRS